MNASRPPVRIAKVTGLYRWADDARFDHRYYETTHAAPTFLVHDVVHYAVGNMPGAVPHTSTHALTNATLPYLTELARRGARDAARRDPALACGVNTLGGHVVNPTVADALGRSATPLDDLLSPR